MKIFEWTEVVEFLDNNLDKDFDFCHSMVEKDCCCLMAQFFRDKGVDFLGVDYNGFEALAEREAVARVVDAPIDRIERIHLANHDQPVKGVQIKKELDKLTNSN